MQNSTIVLLLEGMIKICSKVQCKNIDFHKTYFFLKKTTVDRVCVHVGDFLLFLQEGDISVRWRWIRLLRPSASDGGFGHFRPRPRPR